VTLSRSDFSARLRERAPHDGLPLEDAVLDALWTYYGLLAKWNAKINLTALRLDPVSDEAIDRILVEPLAATKQVTNAESWLDLGSGGGSPAIPMRIVLGHSKLTMVERRDRKAAFLREVVRALGLASATVRTEDVEVVLRQAKSLSVQLVTVRALRLTDRILDGISHALAPDGRLVLFQTGGGDSASFQAPSGFSVASRIKLNTSGSPVVLNLQPSNVPRGTLGR
jgi:16S rRNA (guanine527-N7)-methyltransferase